VEVSFIKHSFRWIFARYLSYASLEYVENAIVCFTLLIAYSSDADVDNAKKSAKNEVSFKKKRKLTYHVRETMTYLDVHAAIFGHCVYPR
jgi:hypothetical protein